MKANLHSEKMIVFLLKELNWICHTVGHTARFTQYFGFININIENAVSHKNVVENGRAAFTVISDDLEKFVLISSQNLMTFKTKLKSTSKRLKNQAFCQYTPKIYQFDIYMREELW